MRTAKGTGPSSPARTRRRRRPPGGGAGWGAGSERGAGGVRGVPGAAGEWEWAGEAGEAAPAGAGGICVSLTSHLGKKRRDPRVVSAYLGLGRGGRCLQGWDKRHGLARHDVVAVNRG